MASSAAYLQLARAIHIYFSSALRELDASTYAMSVRGFIDQPCKHRKHSDGLTLGGLISARDGGTRSARRRHLPYCARRTPREVDSRHDACDEKGKVAFSGQTVPGDWGLTEKGVPLAKELLPNTACLIVESQFCLTVQPERETNAITVGAVPRRGCALIL